MRVHLSDIAAYSELSLTCGSLTVLIGVHQVASYLGVQKFYEKMKSIKSQCLNKNKENAVKI